MKLAVVLRWICTLSASLFWGLSTLGSPLHLPQRLDVNFSDSTLKLFTFAPPGGHARWTISASTDVRHAITLQLHIPDSAQPLGINPKPILVLNGISRIESGPLLLPQDTELVLAVALDRAGEVNVVVDQQEPLRARNENTIVGERTGLFTESRKLEWQPSAKNSNWSLSFQSEPGMKFEVSVPNPHSGSKVLKPDSLGRIELTNYVPRAEKVAISFNLPANARLYSEFKNLGPAGKETERELETNILETEARYQGTFYDDNDQDSWQFQVVGDKISQHAIRVDAADAAAFVQASLFAKNNRKAIAQVEGLGYLVFENLNLPKGDYTVELGPSSQKTAYSIARSVIDHSGDLLIESEPNNIAEFANPIGSKGFIKGELSANDVDFLLLDTYHLKAAERWRIQVNGEGVSRLKVGKKQITRAKNSSSSLKIDNLFLLPGKHLVAIEGDGKYSLKANNLGGPLANFELEPNDEATGPAQSLIFGQTITGALQTEGDQDYFRFQLSNRALIRLDLSSPVDSDIQAQILWGEEPIGKEFSNPKGQTSSTEKILEAGEYRLRVRTEYPSIGEYKALVDILTLFPAQSTGLKDLKLHVTLAQEPARLFAEEGQVVPVSVEVRNETKRPRALLIEGRSSLWGSLVALPSNLQIAPESAETLLGELRLPSDVAESRVTVEVRVSEGTGSLNSKADLKLLEDANIQRPIAYNPVPEALRGGLNLAWDAMGGQWEGSGKGNITASVLKSLNQINNGISPYWSAFSFRKGLAPEDVRLRLGGPDVPTVAGFAINTRTTDKGTERLKDFILQATLDGEIFTTVFEGSLAAVNSDQFFVFEKPLQAKYFRLMPLTNFKGETFPRNIWLQELKIISAPTAPGVKPPDDIATRELGTHLVYHTFRMGISAGDFPLFYMASAADDNFKCAFSKDSPKTHWVVGFHHNRAAFVQTIELKPVVSAQDYSVSIETSDKSPFGPWELAPYDGRDGLTASFPQGKFVRFVRFVLQGDPATGYRCGWNLDVKEKTDSAGFNSILGEWGAGSSRAGLEFSQKVALSATPMGGLDRDHAVELSESMSVSSSVKLERNEDWYYLPPHTRHNAARFSVAQEVHTELSVNLFREDSRNASAIQRIDTDLPILDELGRKNFQYQAWLDKGKGYFLRVSEAPRNVVATWDQSGSVAASQDYIFSALQNWSEKLQIGKEFAQIFPFAAKPLISGWADYPFLIQAALNDVPYAPSSDADNALLQAANLLKNRSGAKAVIITTDADAPIQIPLWSALSANCPRIFAIGLSASASDDGMKERTMETRMQDWASACFGEYRSINGFSDVERSFHRASVKIRAPKHYSLTTERVSLDPPRPGTLKVEIDPKLEGRAADSVLVILDTSGSMLQSISGKVRIDMAKSSLLSLLTKIPKGINFGLLAFGNTKDSCETIVALPFSEYSKSRVEAGIKALKAVNLVKTPIGKALTEASNTIRDRPGRSTILLITDGEETCGGNPEAAIREVRADGIDTTVSIIGFAVEDRGLAEHFGNWAKLGGGVYYDAQDQQTLLNSLQDVVRPRVTVLTSNRDVAATGKIGEKISLVPGRYRVVLDSLQHEQEITVRAATESVVRFK